ncbi:MAG: Uma2 family endonuclease [Rhodopila sp.]
MSVSLKPLTVDEFLAWERAQPARYEFDGIQPVAMTGGSRLHARMIARLTLALGNRLRAPCEVFSSELKVITNGRVRYPGVSVVCSADGDDDTIEPAVVFEVLSPSTALTGRRVKAAGYAAVPGILAHVMLETDRAEITIRRRATDWEAETIEGPGANLSLPETGVTISLADLYRH